MKLKDILNELGQDWKLIMYRTWFEDEDMLFGYCQWVDGELKSLDGDNYSLEDIIEKYETDEYDGEEYLTVWFNS